MPVNEKQLRTLMANNDELHKETRECIKEALIELLQKTRYNDISMTDIINRSGVSRAGVYKNYKSKTEIMLDIYKVFLDDIISELTGSIYKMFQLPALPVRPGNASQMPCKT